MFRLRILVIILSWIFVGCGERRADASDKAEQHGSDSQLGEVPLPEGALRWGNVEPAQSWSEETLSSIETSGGSLLQVVPVDIANFCPRFGELDLEGRKLFWAYLLSSIAELESQFNPKLTYKEQFKDGSGRLVLSRGLLQLSYESVRYYGCQIRSGKELNDPLINLRCGVAILARRIVADQRIAGRVNKVYRGASAYWAVLRSQRKSAIIRSWTRAFSYCRKVVGAKPPV